MVESVVCDRPTPMTGVLRGECRIPNASGPVICGACTTDGRLSPLTSGSVLAIAQAAIENVGKKQERNQRAVSNMC